MGTHHKKKEEEKKMKKCLEMFDKRTNQNFLSGIIAADFMREQNRRYRCRW